MTREPAGTTSAPGPGTPPDVPWSEFNLTLPAEPESPEAFDRFQQVLTALVVRGVLDLRTAGELETAAEEDGPWRAVLALAKALVAILEEK